MAQPLPAKPGSEAIDPSDVLVVAKLLDPHLVPGQNPVSCIAAALRDARTIVGRDEETGKLVSVKQGVAWAGALVYLVFCEQIGSCFHLVGQRSPRKEPLRRALVQFGGFVDADAIILVKLRNHLSHDFTIVQHSVDNRPGYSFALHGSADEPVVRDLGGIYAIGLPALALRVETEFMTKLLVALDQGNLACHHDGGVDGVLRRFTVGIVGPDHAWEQRIEDDDQHG
jgi:hypothetical protein